MARKIEIYEFSRAFENVHYSDKYNSWVSGGYASEKINRFNKIPHPDIKKAVTSGYFSLNDSYPPVNGEVALIGCDLGIYSLLAVANGQIDDGGRPTIGYRYFWLEKEKDDTEIDGLGTILFWWLQSEKPQFDMEKARYQETPEVSLTDNVVTRETFKAEFEAAIAKIVSEPLIPYIKVVNSQDSWLQKYPDYIECHYIAYYFSLDYDRNLAWAWNVRRLIHPENFISIYAATERYLPNVSRIKITNIAEENQQPIIKINQQTSQIEECLKDIESRFTSKKSLQNTGKLNDLLAYLAEPENFNHENFNIDRRLYDNSQIYRALLALILPNETKTWLDSWLDTENLETSKFKLSLSLHQQLFEAAKKQNQRAYEYLCQIVNVHIADLLLELVSVNNKQKLANIKYLLNKIWNLPFKKYAKNLEKTLFNFLENQERNQEYDEFHNDVLDNLQQRQFRNKKQFFDRGNKFVELVYIFKQNGFSKLASIFIFFDNKKLSDDTRELLINFLIPPDINASLETKSRLDTGLSSVLVNQPIQMITYIILLPITILFGTNRQTPHREYISDNDDSEFPKAAFFGLFYILVGAAIVFFIGHHNIALITSIFSCIIGGFVLLGSAIRFGGNDILSKLLFAFMLLGIGGIIYYFAYNHQLPPSQNTSMNYITSLGNIKILPAD